MCVVGVCVVYVCVCVRTGTAGCPVLQKDKYSRAAWERHEWQPHREKEKEREKRERRVEKVHVKAIEGRIWSAGVTASHSTNG